MTSAFFQTWQFYALASAVFASLTAIFGKLGVAKISSDLATLIRTVVVFFVLLALISYKKEWAWDESITKKSIFFLVLSGIATGCSWLFYYRALQMGEASRVAPVDKMSVALTVILAFFILGEPFSLKTLLGTFFVLLGTFLLLK